MAANGSTLRAILLALATASCTGTMLRVDAAAGEDPEPTGPGYLRAYKEAHYRDLGTRFTAVLTDAEFHAEVARSRVLFLGDHHRDARLHSWHLQLLTELTRRGRCPILGLEAIGEQDDAHLREYLYGRIDLPELRARIEDRWDGSWFETGEVDNAFYASLLETARRYAIGVFPLEPTPRLPLPERDAAMADKIQRVALDFPGRLVVVIVGHAHLLGHGRLVERVGLPATVVGARLSRSLQAALDAMPPLQAPRYLRTDRGVLFFRQPSPAF